MDFHIVTDLCNNHQSIQNIFITSKRNPLAITPLSPFPFRPKQPLINIRIFDGTPEGIGRDGKTTQHVSAKIPAQPPLEYECLPLPTREGVGQGEGLVLHHCSFCHLLALLSALPTLSLICDAIFPWASEYRIFLWSLNFSKIICSHEQAAHHDIPRPTQAAKLMGI